MLRECYNNTANSCEEISFRGQAPAAFLPVAKSLPQGSFVSSRRCGLLRAAMVQIAIKNVTKRFGETVALDRVEIEIAAGEIFFLLGPSGCGKTTLLRCIAGFYFPDDGSIFFGNENVTRVPPHRRNTAMMFQSYALWPHMTVEQNVAFGLHERNIPKPEIRRR